MGKKSKRQHPQKAQAVQKPVVKQHSLEDYQNALQAGVSEKGNSAAALAHYTNAAAMRPGDAPHAYANIGQLHMQASPGSSGSRLAELFLRKAIEQSDSDSDLGHLRS